MIQYPKYKATGIDWIKEIPEGWDIKKCLWVFRSISSGSTPETEKRIYYDNGHIPWVVTGDLNDTEISNVNNRITANALNDYKILKLYHSGTLLVAMYGATIGKVGILGFEATINQACCALTESNIISNKFASLWFISQRNFIINQSYGGGQPNISQNFIKQFYIPLPPLPEQRAVAEYLDNKTETINKQIDKQKKLIELLKEKRSAIITEAITKGLNPNSKLKPSGIDWIGDIPEDWEVRKIKHTTYVKGRIGWQNLRSEEFSTEGILCITGTDFKEGRIDIDNAYRVGYERYEQDPNIQLRDNDLLITKDGTIGKVALIKGLTEKATLNSGIFVTRPKKNEYLQDYMFWILHSKIFTDFIEIMLKGTTINHLYQYVFQGFSFPIPDKSEQQKIVEHIKTKTETIDKLINKATQVIEKLGEYKQALITEAVTGKICIFSDLTQESKITEIVEENQKKDNKAFKRNVLAAEIIHQLHKEPTFGHVKFEKIMFLCEKSIDADFSDYKRAAAGPYDNKAIRGIDAQLKKSKWYEAKKEEKRIIYIPLEKAGEHDKYFNNYFSNTKDTIKKIVNLLRKSKTEECEIVATLYSAWFDFIIAGNKPSDKMIVDEVLTNWHESKKRIERDRWVKALKWMKDNNLIPKG